MPSTPDRQPRMGGPPGPGGPSGGGGFGGNDYSMGGGQPQMNNMRPNNMNRQARPQSIDPSRASNIQSHNFGGMGMQNQQRPNDDFFGNSGMKGSNMGPSNSNGDDIDWGL